MFVAVICCDKHVLTPQTPQIRQQIFSFSVLLLWDGLRTPTWFLNIPIMYECDAWKQHSSTRLLPLLRHHLASAVRLCSSCVSAYTDCATEFIFRLENSFSGKQQTSKRCESLLTAWSVPGERIYHNCDSSPFHIYQTFTKGNIKRTKELKVGLMSLSCRSS